MAETKEIDLTIWEDIVSGGSGNPLAEDSILDYARQGEVLVNLDGQIWVPREKNSRWELIPVLDVRKISDWLGLAPDEVQRLLTEAEVPTTCKRGSRFLGIFEYFWRKEDIEAGISSQTVKNGLDDSAAALELGLVLADYRGLADSIPFRSGARILKVFLEAYRNEFLPKNKTWSSRSSLLREFLQNYNAKNPTDQIRTQTCEVAGCGEVASDQCVNENCQNQGHPRFICPAHEVWVDIRNIVERPPSLCPPCAAGIETGDLAGYPLL